MKTALFKNPTSFFQDYSFFDRKGEPVFFGTLLHSESQHSELPVKRNK